jgi:hypothetical protein
MARGRWIGQRDRAGSEQTRMQSYKAEATNMSATKPRDASCNVLDHHRREDR